MISTDSDIGTSPSGTTFASQPSSPQQINPESYNLYNFFTDYANKKMLSGATKSTINSSDMSFIGSDNIKKQSPEYFNPRHIEIVDHLQGLSIASKKQLGNLILEIKI